MQAGHVDAAHARCGRGRAKQVRGVKTRRQVRGKVGRRGREVLVVVRGVWRRRRREERRGRRRQRRRNGDRRRRRRGRRKRRTTTSGCCKTDQMYYRYDN